jgi:hypothetical protein
MPVAFGVFIVPISRVWFSVFPFAKNFIRCELVVNVDKLGDTCKVSQRY